MGSQNKSTTYIAQTARFSPSHTKYPAVSKQDALIQAAQDLTTALLQQNEISAIDPSQRRALQDLTRIFSESVPSQPKRVQKTQNGTVDKENSVPQRLGTTKTIAPVVQPPSTSVGITAPKLVKNTPVPTQRKAKSTNKKEEEPFNVITQL